jgi:hypothetical protein
MQLRTWDQTSDRDNRCAYRQKADADPAIRREGVGFHLASLALGLSLAASAAFGTEVVERLSGKGAGSPPLLQEQASVPDGALPPGTIAPPVRNFAVLSSVVFYIVDSEEQAKAIRRTELAAGQDEVANSSGSAGRQVAVLVVESPEADLRAQSAVGGTFAEAALSGAFSVEVHDLRAR